MNLIFTLSCETGGFLFYHVPDVRKLILKIIIKHVLKHVKIFVRYHQQSYICI